LSASIINTNNNTKIFSTNNINKIEVSNENIIQSDSESREVIKKGYLLSQINLSSVPSVIADAINQAMIDTKNATLSDALIDALRTSLENLDDGVYKKTYIDNMMTYVENLLTSKVNLETVASIADSKLAVALEGFATTSSVSTLSSKVGNSETEITNIKETINTNDTARATQIEELEASIEDTFAGYSSAIELYVDENGNVKSEKIEKLELGNYIQKVSINEENKIELDELGNYTAISSKVILNSDGKIVGFKFTDTNDLATFKINTDVFEISNSTNSYTPFRIEDNNLLFNGKVTFSNITGGENIVTIDNVQDAINNNVTAINGGIVVTNEAFVNNLNAVGGVIADNVNANDFYGKNFYGGYFEGARINGAVIKASYLDLDGELEVLTNYHITMSMYNANPSLYTDAVYISADNEYRIPSMSTVKEGVKSGRITSISSIYGDIWAYNVANVGTNIKAVKINPTFLNTSDLNIVTSQCGDGGVGSTGIKNNFSIKLGDTILLQCIVSMIPASSGNGWQTRTEISGTMFATIVHTEYTYSLTNKAHTHNLNIGIGIVELKYNFNVGSYTDSDGTGYSGPNRIKIICNLLAGESIFPYNWTSGRLSINQLVSPYSYLQHNNTGYSSGLGYTDYSLKQSLQINNMI
jgi:hypothetical protein